MGLEVANREVASAWGLVARGNSQILPSGSLCFPAISRATCHRGPMPPCLALSPKRLRWCKWQECFKICQHLTLFLHLHISETIVGRCT